MIAIGLPTRLVGSASRIIERAVRVAQNRYPQGYAEEWPPNVNFRELVLRGCALLPTHAFTQRGDVREMMSRVPRVHAQHTV